MIICLWLVGERPTKIGSLDSDQSLLYPFFLSLQTNQPISSNRHPSHKQGLHLASIVVGGDVPRLLRWCFQRCFHFGNPCVEGRLHQFGAGILFITDAGDEADNEAALWCLDIWTGSPNRPGLLEPSNGAEIGVLVCLGVADNMGLLEGWRQTGIGYLCILYFFFYIYIYIYTLYIYIYVYPYIVYSIYIYTYHTHTYIHIYIYIQRDIDKAFSLVTRYCNPQFTHHQSRISFDMLKSMRRTSIFFAFQNNKPQNLETHNPKNPTPQHPKTWTPKLFESGFDSVFVHLWVALEGDVTRAAASQFGGAWFNGRHLDQRIHQ